MITRVMDVSVVEMSLQGRVLKIKSRFVPRIFPIQYQINGLFTLLCWERQSYHKISHIYRALE